VAVSGGNCLRISPRNLLLGLFARGHNSLSFSLPGLWYLGPPESFP